MVGVASFEESARKLARDLDVQGHPLLASFLLEMLPGADEVSSGEQRELVAARLRRIADTVDVAPPLRTAAAGLAETAADAISLRGRAGTVWIAWDDGDNGPGGPPHADPGYHVSWQADRGDDGDWREEGPWASDLPEALAWARARADAVIVRPAWDANTHYWAGRGPDWRKLPPLGESHG